MSVAKRNSAPLRMTRASASIMPAATHAPLVMAPFWPGIGVEHENARKECVRSRLDNGLSVAAPQAHVGELLALDPGKRRDDAVEKRLAADNPNIGIGLRLLNEMLACAEPDLQPHFARRRGERTPRRQRLRRNRKQRQRFGEQTLLARAKRLAAAASIEPASRRRPVASADSQSSASQWAAGQARARSVSARSVFSHEKPPSASGARPKWP